MNAYDDREMRDVYIGVNELALELAIDYARLTRLCATLGIKIVRKGVARRHPDGYMQMRSIKLIEVRDAESIRRVRHAERENQKRRGDKRLSRFDKVLVKTIAPKTLIETAKRECQYFSEIEIRCKLQCTAEMARAIHQEIMQQGGVYE